MPTEQMEQTEQTEQLDQAAERRPHAHRPGAHRSGSDTAAGLRPRNPLRALRRLRNDDAGAATAEYLVATMAAVGFAGLLIVILRGNEVRGILTELVRNALSVG